MGSVQTRRQTRSRPSPRRAWRSTNGEDNDSGPRLEETLAGMLPGQGLAREWADIDDADGSDLERAAVLADADLVIDEVSVPVIPRQADEFMCSSCFLIQHISRLAFSNDGHPICADCT